MYYYSLYNMSISSQVSIRPLTPLDSPPSGKIDVTISLGTPPKELSQEPLVKNVCTQMAENEFLFFHEALGIRIYVKNKEEIVIDRDLYTDPDQVSLFLLGSVIGSILYMRDIIPMHAATIRTDRGAVLLTGKSGAGKSTLAFGLMRRGYNILGDDVAPLTVSNGDVFVYPGNFQLKLWQKSLDMGRVYQHEYPRVRKELEKYYVDIDLPVSDCLPLPVVQVYHLTTHNWKDIQTIEMDDALKRLRIIRSNSYRRPFIKGLKKEVAHFRTSTELAAAPMFLIKRPVKTDFQRFTVSDFQNFIDSVEASLPT